MAESERDLSGWVQPVGDADCRIWTRQTPTRRQTMDPFSDAVGDHDEHGCPLDLGTWGRGR